MQFLKTYVFHMTVFQILKKNILKSLVTNKEFKFIATAGTINESTL